MEQLHLNIFQESNSNVLNQLLHCCADEICGRAGPSYQQYSNNINWTEDDYNCAYSLFSSILRTPGALYLDAEKMPHDYHILPEPVQMKMMDCLKVRQDQLTAALLREYSKKRSLTMTDFDYRLKLTMGSSKLASLREPLLELDLTVERDKDRSTLSIEMNREELDSLINALESIEH